MGCNTDGRRSMRKEMRHSTCMPGLRPACCRAASLALVANGKMAADYADPERRVNKRHVNISHHPWCNVAVGTAPDAAIDRKPPAAVR